MFIVVFRRDHSPTWPRVTWALATCTGVRESMNRCYLSTRNRSRGVPNTDVANPYLGIGAVYKSQGRYEEALVQ